MVNSKFYDCAFAVCCLRKATNGTDSFLGDEHLVVSTERESISRSETILPDVDSASFGTGVCALPFLFGSELLPIGPTFTTLRAVSFVPVSGKGGLTKLAISCHWFMDIPGEGRVLTSPSGRRQSQKR